MATIAQLYATIWRATTVGEATTHTGVARIVWQTVELIASVAFLTGLFASLYRVVPQTDVRWGDVFGGAFLASLLLIALKGLLAFYLARVGEYAAYGAVGGVLVLLTWIYVASLIVLYGAEFCCAYAERRHATSIPKAPPV